MSIFFVVFFHLLTLINIKFTAWPEMVFWPYMVVNNMLPYQDFAMVHTPILVLTLSIFYKVFGVGVIQLKVFTWLLIVLTDLGLYLLLSKIWNNKKTMVVVAVLVYTLLQVFNEGNGLWFETALTPLALGLFYFVLQKKYFTAGLTWGLMLFTKQTAIWFFVPILLSFYESKGFNLSAFKRFLKGTFILTFSVIVLLWAFGILDDFYRWAINFGIFVLPNSQGQIQFPNLRTLFIVLLPYLFFVPFVVKRKYLAIWLFTWTVSGALGAYPRFEYFHLQPSLPFLAISFTYFLIDVYSHLKFKVYVPITFALLVLFMMFGFAIKNVGEGVRFYEKDVVDVSKYINNSTKKDEKIFVLNYWDNIYAFSDRLPAVKLWIPQLSWYLEVPGVQEEMILSLQTLKPSVVVLKPYTNSGLSAYKPEKLYQFLIGNYKYKESISGIDIYELKI